METQRDNPFDYLPADLDGNVLPMSYGDLEQGLLSPYLMPPGDGDGRLADFAPDIAEGVDYQAQPFLYPLNDEIYNSFCVVKREYGEASTAEETLDSEVVACRDVAVLFIEPCRQLGIGARFVSGHQESDPQAGERELHAWADVYLPGGGWRGYDPTLGLVVADRHVALAASAYPKMAAPVTGNFRGTDATSTLESQIAVSTGNTEVRER